ncbi:hypothetical protein ILUMI_09628 [Ignelater luminosus]|uniref:Uncharacterized protein n=1 Tax=Ignelater luminosus TaxID=2038154 RepID=A0A8K0D3I2_IGNLU|nr:hypothetical protein ILUMI_09628 [Ignelater luminosus]
MPGGAVGFETQRLATKICAFRHGQQELEHLFSVKEWRPLRNSLASGTKKCPAPALGFPSPAPHKTWTDEKCYESLEREFCIPVKPIIPPRTSVRHRNIKLQNGSETHPPASSKKVKVTPSRSLSSYTFEQWFADGKEN